MIDLASIRAGFEFPPQELVLDTATVAPYVTAVEDGWPGFAGPSAVVPPLAALALAMRGLTELLLRHPGVLHATQQVTCLRPVALGSTVSARLVVRSRSMRRGFAWLTLDARIGAADGPAVEGSMLLMVPLAEPGGVHG